MAKKGTTKRAEQAASQARMKVRGLADVWAADEIPFIQAIVADRFNDAPRLIFADWLEERGDPRAEFLRVQCQLARLRMRDEAYEPLRVRSEQLIRLHHNRWLKPYPTLPATKWGIGGTFYHRGLLNAAHSLTLLGMVYRAPLLIDTLGISALQVPLTKQSEVERLAGLPQLAGLDGLVLRGDRSLDFSPLWQSPQLGPIARLGVESSHCLRAGFSAFLARSSARGLRQLKLNTCWPEDLQPLLEWKHLGELDDIEFGADHEHRMFDMFEHSRLRLSTYFCDARLPAEALARLPRLAQAPLLSQTRDLTIQAPPDMPELWSTLVLPPCVRRLSILSPNWQASFDANTQAFLQSSAVEQLETLEFLYGGMTEATALELACCQRLRKLKSLHLPISHYDTAMRIVESPCAVPTIKFVSMGFTKDRMAQLRRKFAGTLEFGF